MRDTISVATHLEAKALKAVRKIQTLIDRLRDAHVHTVVWTIKLFTARFSSLYPALPAERVRLSCEMH